MEKLIALASDHGGYRLKTILKTHLEKNGHGVLDLGCDTEESVDYPDFSYELTRAVRQGRSTFGVLICGTGIGMSIAANRFVTIRAALVHTVEEAELAREHNNANVICFGGRTIGPRVATKCLDAFLEAEFTDGGRHARRVEKLTKYRGI